MGDSASKKGRLSWLIDVFEILIAIAYFVIGFKGIMKAFKHMDFAGMFHSVEVAIWFLIIATAINTLLCFIPIFRSKGNYRLAVWNIIWIAFSIYSII